MRAIEALVNQVRVNSEQYGTYAQVDLTLVVHNASGLHGIDPTRPVFLAQSSGSVLSIERDGSAVVLCVLGSPGQARRFEDDDDSIKLLEGIQDLMKEIR